MLIKRALYLSCQTSKFYLKWFQDICESHAEVLYNYEIILSIGIVNKISNNYWQSTKVVTYLISLTNPDWNFKSKYFNIFRVCLGQITILCDFRLTLGLCGVAILIVLMLIAAYQTYFKRCSFMSRKIGPFNGNMTYLDPYYDRRRDSGELLCFIVLSWAAILFPYVLYLIHLC